MADATDLFSFSGIALEISENYGSVDSQSLERAKRAINRALWNISRKGIWSFSNFEDTTFTTAEGQEYYYLSSRIKIPEYMRTINPARKIYNLSKRRLITAVPNDTDRSGAPLFFRVAGYDKARKSWKIALFPEPDGEYDVYVDAQYHIPLMSDDDEDIRSTSGIPEDMIETVIQLGTAIMYEKSDNENYKRKMAEAQLQLDDDYYRYAANPDEELSARVFSQEDNMVFMDPRLPDQFS